jgi:hypothetical protein
MIDYQGQVDMYNHTERKNKQVKKRLALRDNSGTFASFLFTYL